MYILDFFQGFPNHQRPEDMVSFEYRLLCSGELYNGQVLTGDWRKSDATRILSDSQFTLIVCSHPFNEFPQELALRFSAPYITEKRGQSTSIFLPDEDIARDLAALLTLHCRRLITVAVKIRECYPYKSHLFQDWPNGFVNSMSKIHWENKPSTVVYGRNGISTIDDNNPPPLCIDSERLQHLLLNFSHLPFAENVILCARLYSLALQQLEHDVDIAYQLLIAAVETAASDAFHTYSPTDEQMINSKKSVATLAQKYGLSEEQACQLAKEACKGISWASRKFTKFLIDYSSEELWKEDDLFKVPVTILPKREDFGTVLNSIYEARGKLTHGGHSFPSSSAIGIRPTISSRVFMSVDWSSMAFPPVVWFERVVNNALNEYIGSSIKTDIGKDTPSTNLDNT
jgi:hypothetical protein